MKTILFFLVLFFTNFVYADIEDDLRQGLKQCSWTSDNPMNVLLDVTTKTLKGREFLFSVWTHGAHGETLRIFDPSRKSHCMIFEQTSGFDISYKILRDGNVEITFSQETSIDNPTPIEHKITFRPRSK